MNIEDELARVLAEEIDRELLNNITNSATYSNPVTMISTPLGNNVLYGNYFNIERTPIQATTRTIRSRWTIDIENELSGMYNIFLNNDFEIFGQKPIKQPEPIIPDSEFFI